MNFHTGRFGFRQVRLVKTDDKSLGIGSYGAVYRAQCDDLICAAKVLHPILFETRDQGAHRIVERFQQEIEFLSGLRHPHIIQYLGSYLDPETGLPVLFMEMMDESLTNFLEHPANSPPLPLYVQVNIAHDVAQALSHLHHHRVLHRDLSSNNVLLIGSKRAKLTNFGMAKLLDDNLRLTPTYCPGTNVYMSPEALADPPTYTNKLDIFSYGVLIVQLITRKFPNPGLQTCTVCVNNPQFPSGQALRVVEEFERRKEHLNLISPTHPLLEIALESLKDKEEQHPTAEHLCSCLLSLKETSAYENSSQQETADLSHVNDEQMEQQQMQKEVTNEDLISEELLQLRRQHREQEKMLRECHKQIQQLQQDLIQKEKENRRLQDKVRQLKILLSQGRQENASRVELQSSGTNHTPAQNERKMESDMSPNGGCPLKLDWRNGPSAPFVFDGYSAAICGDEVYFSVVSLDKILMFNWKKEQWTILTDCPRKFFSIAVVNGQLTAVGGGTSYLSTKSLLSLSSNKWIEIFPPMIGYHNNPVVATTKTALIVAGGFGPVSRFGPERSLTSVEFMDTQLLQWSVVASLPHPIQQASATICQGKLFISSGFVGRGCPSQSVLMCEVDELIGSRSKGHASTTGKQEVWKELMSLPLYFFFLVTFKGQLLSIGGTTTAKDDANAIAEVRQYNLATDSWNVVSKMGVKRNSVLAVSLPNDSLMVCGGDLSDGNMTALVEIASIHT